MNKETNESLADNSEPVVYDLSDEAVNQKAYEEIQSGNDLWVSFISEAGRSKVYWRFSGGKKVADVHSSGGEDILHYPRLKDGGDLGEFVGAGDALRAVDEYIRMSGESISSVH